MATVALALARRLETDADILLNIGLLTVPINGGGERDALLIVVLVVRQSLYEYVKYKATWSMSSEHRNTRHVTLSMFKFEDEA